MIASRISMGVVWLLLAAAPASATVILGSSGIGVVDNGDSNALNGSRITVGSTSAAVTSMGVFVGTVDASPNDRYQVAIYTDSNGAPGTLVVASPSATLTANAWNSVTVSAALQANTSYWLMYNTNGRTAALNNMYYTQGSAGQGAYGGAAVPFGTWPASFGSAIPSTAVYALHATAESDGADPRATVGEWSPVMNWPLIAIHANLLKTGRVLLWDEQDTVTQPKLWDPTSLALSDTPLVGSEIFCSGHTQLADGRIVVAGGHEPHAGEVGTNFTYQYLPDSNTWIPTGDMLYDRWYPALTKLSDGRVAIFSGQITTRVFANTLETYEPASGSVTPVTGITTAQLWEEEYPINFHLPSGEVLAMSPEHGAVQLFDPGPPSWTQVTTTPFRLGSAVQYRPGRILMTGGGSGFLAPAQTQAAVLDMNAPTPAWRTTNAMASGRYMHNLVMLPMGDVLAVGGSSTADQQAASGPLPIELWNADTETWTTLAALALPRMYHSTALLLPDGRVLAAGGGHNGAAPNYFSAQIYSPPYLFRGPRPAISSAPSVIAYGAAPFVVASPDAANVAKINLIALGSVTHSTDMNQSYTELAFTSSPGQLQISPPADGNQVPPGYYMLFIVDDDGVPSIARMVRVGSDQSEESFSCSNAVARPRLVLGRLATAPGDDRLTLQGQVTLQYPFDPPLDPLATGVRLLVSHAEGNVLDVTIPGGAYVDPPGVGWKASENRWTYSNDSAAPAGGIVRLVIKQGSAGTPGLVKFRVTGRAGAYPVSPANLPLGWRIVLNPPVARCGTASFPGPAPAPRCRVNMAGSTVSCK